jgi:hypothetical protein
MKLAPKLLAVCLAALLIVVVVAVAGCGRSSLEPLNEIGNEGDASVDGDGATDGPSEGGPDSSHLCRSNKDCDSTPSTPYCEVPPGKCVACEVPSQCPTGDTCIDFQCVPLCPGGDCPGDLSCCIDENLSICVNEQTDPNNCGGCNRKCQPGQSCVDANCQEPTSCNGGPVCSPEDQCCPSGCADLNSDPLNCGKCGHLCAPTATCVAGACHTPTTCNGGPACMPPDVCCGSGCVDTSSDPNNCGKCGFACSPGETCVESQCKMGASCNGEPACTGGQTCCIDGCTDTQTDPDNCGMCNHACGPGSMCQKGSCTPPVGCNDGAACTLGDTCCPSGCTNTDSDPNNCGTCGRACGPDNTCSSGFCQSPMTCNGGPACSGTLQCCGDGCDDTTSDNNDCGKCGNVCPLGDTCVSSKCTPSITCNTGPACSTGETCCPLPTGCTNTDSDPNNCGGCGIPCAPPNTCTDGFCVNNEGGLNPFVNPTYLTPGVHNYTTIDIPAGVTVYVAGGGPGSGTLQLNATGVIIVDGTIDLSGGPGTQNTITSMSTESGSAGSGGYTGEPYQSAAPSSPCGFVAGNPGLLGFDAEGTAGGCMIFTGCDFGTEAGGCSGSPGLCPEVFTASLANWGGGAGIFTGYRAYGSGGGGPAGGAPGALGAAYPGEEDCSGVAGAGGAVNGQGGSGGGAPYDGLAGVSGQTQCMGLATGVPPAYVGGGGGGSIGPFASGDLAVATTFQTGSGGGGGSADYLNRPEFGGSSGGGGGGGALRLSTPASVTINGQVLANGGAGGDAFIGTGSTTDCNPQPGSAGGGGSGGVIFISAPVISVGSGATISAVGGAGGATSEFATGGGGGAGGLGRIRLSITPATCTLGGTFNPPLVSGCTAASSSGKTYVGAYPN